MPMKTILVLCLILIKEYPDIAVVCGRYSWDILNKRLNEHDVSVNQIYIDDFIPFEWGRF